MTPARVALALAACFAATSCKDSAVPSAPDAGPAPAADVGVGRCASDKTECGSDCVDLATSEAHCGFCDNACTEGWECVDGACQITDCRQTPCPGGSWCDPASNRCLPGCTSDATCRANEACDLASHACACKEGFRKCVGASACSPASEPCGQPSCGKDRTLCGDSCVDVWTDPRHCGECDVACQPGEVCRGTCQRVDDCRQTPCSGFTWCDTSNGICKPGCRTSAECDPSETCDAQTHTCICPTKFHRCSGVCVSDLSPSSCGQSCGECPYDPFGDPTCDGVSCGIRCRAGFHLCGGACASNRAVETCGQGCSPCPDNDPHGTAVCDGAACGIACDAGYHLCNGTCVSDLSTANCGSRCEPCPAKPNGLATCDGTSCGTTCDAGFLLCDGACAACPAATGSAGVACAAGRCVHAACAPGFHLCDGVCRSNADAATCGGSCTPCSTSQANAHPVCDGVSCGVDCNSGFLMCAGACALCPSGPGNGSFSCDAASCKVASCARGYHFCGEVCSDNASIASCGSGCTPCSAPSGGWATCDGTACGQACPGGTRLCGTTCASCPSDPNAIGFGCAGTGCVITECTAGYHPCATGCCQWSYEDIKKDEWTNQLFAHSAAVTPSGGVGLLYCQSSRHYFATKVAGVWKYESIDYAAECRTTRGALSIDPLGVARVSYLDTKTYELRYNWRDATGWHTGGRIANPVLVQQYGYSGGESSITVDPSNNPHVIVVDGNNGGHARYVAWNGSSWFNEEIDPTAGTGSYMDIAWSPSGYPVVVYGWWDGTAMHARYAQRANGTWTVENYDTETAYGPSLAVAPDGTVYVAYTAARAGGYVLKLAKRTPAGTWTLTDLTTTPATSNGIRAAVAVDATGRVHLARHEGYQTPVSYWRQNGATFTRQDLAEPANYLYGLLLDAAGGPHAVYSINLNLHTGYTGLSVRHAW